MHAFRTALTLLFLLSLTGCGFQLRGSATELSAGGTIFVDVLRGVSLRDELEQAFLDRAYTLADNRDLADVLLRLSDERQDERIVSVQRSGRVSELELRHGVSMQIARAEGDAVALIRPDSVTNRVEVSRQYTYDSRRVLGKAEEARILRAEMRKDLVSQIVLRTLAGGSVVAQ